MPHSPRAPHGVLSTASSIVAHSAYRAAATWSTATPAALARSSKLRTSATSWLPQRRRIRTLSRVTQPASQREQRCCRRDERIETGGCVRCGHRSQPPRRSRRRWRRRTGPAPVTRPAARPPRRSGRRGRRPGPAAARRGPHPAGASGSCDRRNRNRRRAGWPSCYPRIAHSSNCSPGNSPATCTATPPADRSCFHSSPPDSTSKYW